MWDDASRTADEDALNELTQQLSQFNWKDSVVDKAKRLLFSQDIGENIKGAMNLKAMLCIGREEVYEVAQEVIDSGVIIRLVEFLRVDNRDLQWPAAFCLTNVAAGLDAQTQTVVEAGAIDPLVSFLRHPDAQLRRQAIFCLANVAGSIPEYRVALARHPDYFNSMFAAADLAQDLKILELVCWNLRNICLLGGPNFDDIRPGILFLLNRVLKDHLPDQHWAACVRFAMESISCVCRTPEGRELMFHENLLPCLFRHVEKIGTSPTGFASFEALAWLLAFGKDSDRQAAVERRSLLNIVVDEALTGNLGGGIQELALKCLVCIAADPNPELFLRVFQSYDTLADLCGRIFLGFQTLTRSTNSSPSSAGVVTPTSLLVTKECAGFIFAQCCRAAKYNQTDGQMLLVKANASPEIVDILLEMMEFGAEQVRIKQDSSAAPGAGPPLATISAELTVACAKALLSLIKEAFIIREREELPINPFLQMCVQADGIGRVGTAFLHTPLPPEGYNAGNELLHLLTES